MRLFGIFMIAAALIFGGIFGTSTWRGHAHADEPPPPDVMPLAQAQKYRADVLEFQLRCAPIDASIAEANQRYHLGPRDRIDFSTGKIVRAQFNETPGSPAQPAPPASK